MVSTRILMDPVGLFSSMSLKQKYGVPECSTISSTTRVDGRVVAALEAGKLQRHQVGMPRHILGRPHLAAGVLAVRVLPDVGDGHGMRNLAGFHFVAEQAPDDVVVDGQAILREHRVARASGTPPGSRGSRPDRCDTDGPAAPRPAGLRAPVAPALRAPRRAWSRC